MRISDWSSTVCSSDLTVHYGKLRVIVQHHFGNGGRNIFLRRHRSDKFVRGVETRKPITSFAMLPARSCLVYSLFGLLRLSLRLGNSPSRSCRFRHLNTREADRGIDPRLLKIRYGIELSSR